MNIQTISSRWLSLVARTMTNRNCTHGEATRLTAAAYPDFYTLVQANGRTRQTVVFLNSKLAHGTPLTTADERKRLRQFVNANLAAGQPPALAMDKAYREHPELVSRQQFVKITMPGQLGRPSASRAEFANAAGTAPIGNADVMRLFFLPNTVSDGEFNAAWKANGSVATPIDYAKIFDGLVQLDMGGGGNYEEALARCKTKYAELWHAVDALAQLPV